MNETSKDIYDLVIVGGGIAGIGVLLEARKKNLKVLLLEKEPSLGILTSNNSLRIIHGGFRYLQSLDISKTVDSIKNQKFCIENYKNVKVLDCYMPLKRFGLKSPFFAFFGIILYSVLKIIFGSNKVSIPKIIKADESFLEFNSYLKNKKLLFWQDVIMTDQLDFINELVKEDFEDIKFNSILENIEYQENNIKLEFNNNKIITKKLVTCLGPSFDLDLKLQKAVNIIINKKLTNNQAVGVAGEKRLFFVTPRNDKTVIGTFYYPDNKKDLNISESEKNQFLNEFNKASKLNIIKEDIINIDSGLLPEAKNSNKLLNKAIYTMKNQNHIDLVTTKYTSFYTQGKKVLKLLGL